MFNGLMNNIMGVCGQLKGAEPFSYGMVISEPPSLGFPSRDHFYIQGRSAVNHDSIMSMVQGYDAFLFKCDDCCCKPSANAWIVRDNFEGREFFIDALLNTDGLVVYEEIIDGIWVGVIDDVVKGKDMAHKWAMSLVRSVYLRYGLRKMFSYNDWADALRMAYSAYCLNSDSLDVASLYAFLLDKNDYDSSLNDLMGLKSACLSGGEMMVFNEKIAKHRELLS